MRTKTKGKDKDFEAIKPYLDGLKVELSLYWSNVRYLLKSRKQTLYKLVLYYKSMGIPLNKGYLYDLQAGRRVTPNMFILWLIANYLKEPLFKLFTYDYQRGVYQDNNDISINEF